MNRGTFDAALFDLSDTRIWTELPSDQDPLDPDPDIVRDLTANHLAFLIAATPRSQRRH